MQKNKPFFFFFFFLIYYFPTCCRLEEVVVVEVTADVVPGDGEWYPALEVVAAVEVVAVWRS